MGSFPVLRQAADSSEWSWQMVGVCERVAALLLLLITFPLLAICVCVLYVRSGRFPLIAHRRVGWQGADLWMLKLRTMWPDGAVPRATRVAIERIDDEAGPEGKSASDARVPSAFARFCRRHSIDELPQLWHVVSGEMSLVGPRPVTALELQRHYGVHAGEVLRVKPGLAGLWQVSGRNRLTYAERCELDLRLVRERSILLYCTILLRTLPEVFSGENSW
ncbi:MAG: sugar transferase [Candidatus Solibacter sp.]